MVIECKYNKEGICQCSNEERTIEEIEKKLGWICGKTCPLQVSIYTERDRDKYLRDSLVKVKNANEGELCSELMICGHRANSCDDEYAIRYDACIIRLIQLHKREHVSDIEYCEAYELAKRLGIRLPGRSNKIYRRIMKRLF